jgi:hypothetical protein
MYLTPTRFKTLGLGSDLSDVSDAAIAAAIRRSQSRIHNYCAVPQAFSFLGGSVIGEEHSWSPDEFEQPKPFRVFLHRGPISSIEQFRIYITNDIFTEFESESLVINNGEGYVEVSTFQQSIFSAGLTPLVGLFIPISRTDYAYGDLFTVTDELATAISTTIYQAENQFWTSAAVVVKRNGALVDSADYTISRIEGRVTFDSAISPATDEITISYSYPLDPDIAAASGILTAQDIGESDLRKKGMGGLASIRVKDVELRRFGATVSSRSSGGQLDVPDEAAKFLQRHVFVTAR